MFGTKKTRTSPRNHKRNGLKERYNKTLIQMIKSYIRDDQEEQGEKLSFLTAAYRSIPQESRHLTPNLIMLGRETRQAIDLLYRNPNSMDNVNSNVALENM
jgi:hypothetical protein